MTVVTGGNDMSVSGPEKNLLDFDALLHRLDGDCVFAREILDDSIEEITRFVKNLKDLCAGEDAELLSRAAHTLKGMSANIGATTLRKQAMAMEKTASAGDLAAARQMLAELENTASRTIELIRRIDTCNLEKS